VKKQINICNHKYKILHIDFEGLSENFGSTLSTTTTISIDSSITKSKQEVTLAHEILHVFLEESGARELVNENEELLVMIMENTFYDFLKQNTNFYD